MEKGDAWGVTMSRDRERGIMRRDIASVRGGLG